MPVAKNSRWKALHRFGPPTLMTLGVLWLVQGALARTHSHGVIIHNLSYDAGMVKAGSTVTDVVQITNLSPVPVEVAARPSCGCTVASIPEAQLSPLRVESLGFEVDTDGMGKGLQEKRILLTLRSGQQSWERVAVIRFQVR